MPKPNTSYSDSKNFWVSLKLHDILTTGANDVNFIGSKRLEGKTISVKQQLCLWIVVVL